MAMKMVLDEGKGMPAGRWRSAIPGVSAIALLYFSCFAVDWARGEEPGLTVYHQGPGHVTETFQVEISASWGEIFFDPGRWLTESVVVRSADGRGPRVEEMRILAAKSYDPMHFLSYYKGKEVVLRTEGKSWYGILESVDSDGAVIRSEDQHHWVPGTKWEGWELPIFDEPAYRSPRLLIRAGEDGDTRLEVSYLIDGIDWSADYTAYLPAKGDRLQWMSWAQLRNQSGRPFVRARLSLVAGELARSRREVPRPMRMESGAMAAQAPMLGDALAPPTLPEEEALGEIRLYTLPGKVDLALDELKKIALYDPKQVRFRTEYRYTGQNDRNRVRSYVLFENDEDSGLGEPLPKGRVSFYRSAADGKRRALGETWISGLARGEEAELYRGYAFDLVGKRTVLEYTRLSRTSSRQRVRIELSNRKEDAVEVLVQERLAGNWKIVEETMAGEKKEANLLEYRLEIGPDSTEFIEYVVEFQ